MDATLQALISIQARFAPFGRFTIAIDGLRVGKIEQETTQELSVEPGTRTVSILPSWPGRSQLFLVIIGCSTN